MIFKITSLQWLAIAALMMAGCTYHQAPTEPNEGPRNIQLRGAPNPVTASEQKLDSFDLARVEKTVQATKDPKVLHAQLIAMGDFVLNPGYFLDPNMQMSDNLKDMLHDYNATFLKLYKIAPDYVTQPANGVLDEKNQKESLLDEYERAALYNCDINLKGCNGTFAFFQSDYNSAEISQLAVKQLDPKIDAAKVTLPSGGKDCQSACQATVAQYYRLLAWTMGLRNSIRNPSIDFLYLKHAWDYADYVQNLPDSAHKRELYRVHGAIFEDLLHNFPGNWNDPQFADFVSEANVFEYSDLKKDPFPYGRDDLFAMAAGHYLYDSTAKNGQHKLSAKVITAIEKSQAESDSFSKTLNDLLKDQPLIFKTLNVNVAAITDPNFIHSEYFMMVDRLYRGDWDLDKVTQVWKGSDQNEDRLLNTVEYYLKVQMISMLVQTNKYMSDLYAKKDFDPGTLLTQALQNSQPLSQKWVAMLDHAQQVKYFLDSNVNQPGAHYSDYLRTTAMIDGLSRNAKFLSVYPNMMLLVYFMADTGGHLTIDTWFGSLNIDADMIINSLFEGELPPWFRFGKPSDDSALSRYDLIYAFYYALNTGTFETFGDQKDAAKRPIVNRQLFFQKTLNQYFNSETTELQKAYNGLIQERQASSDYDTFLQDCKQEMQNTPDHENYSLQIDFDSLSHYTFGGNGQFGLTTAPQRFYSSDSGPGNEVPDILTDLDRKLVYIRAMVAMLDQNMNTLKKLGVATTISEDDINNINAQIKKIEDLKVNYYNEAMAQHRAVSACMTRFDQIEDQHQKALYKMEMNHLRQVYQAMVSLQPLQGAALTNKINEYNAQFNFTPGLDSISKTVYNYSQVDLMLRMKRRMETQLKPAVIVNMPPDIKKLDYYSNTTALPLFGSDSKMLTEDQFVANAMRLLNGHDHAYLSWVQDTSGIQPELDKINTMVQLYKFGFSLDMPEADRISADEIISETLNLVKSIHLSSEDAQLLTELGLDRKVSRDDVLKLLYNGSEQKYVLDTVADWVLNNSAQLNEATAFYQSSMLVESNLLFTPAPGVKVQLRQTYRPMVTTVEALSNDFLNHAQHPDAFLQAKLAEFSRSLGLSSNQVSLYYEMSQGSSGPQFSTYTIPQNSDSTLALIDPNKQWQYTATMTTFNNNTPGEDGKPFYDVRPGDKECQQAQPPAACNPSIKKNGT